MQVSEAHNAKMSLKSFSIAASDTVRCKNEFLETFKSILVLSPQTVSAILSALLAIVLRPDLQARAQAELDAATGRERLPTFEDRPRLPFVDALCKETQRWRPVTPLGALIAIDDYSRISIHRRTKHFLILSPKTMSMKVSLYLKARHFSHEYVLLLIY